MAYHYREGKGSAGGSNKFASHSTARNDPRTIQQLAQEAIDMQLSADGASEIETLRTCLVETTSGAFAKLSADEQADCFGDPMHVAHAAALLAALDRLATGAKPTPEDKKVLAYGVHVVAGEIHALQLSDAWDKCVSRAKPGEVIKGETFTQEQIDQAKTDYSKSHAITEHLKTKIQPIVAALAAKVNAHFSSQSR